MSQGPVQVAGRHAGKKVNVVPNAVPAYQALNQAALAGNHWARLSMFSLRSLSTGRLDKTHIFVRPGPMVTRGVEQFFLALPGCKATMERRSNDEYYLVNLTIDTTYMEMMGTNKEVGLYKAEKDQDGWGATFYDNGVSDVGTDEMRLVAITDGKYKDAKHAAETIAPSIGKAPEAAKGSRFVKFDMHYSGGSGSYGGLRNFNKARKPLTNQSINGSSIMLAASMAKAQNKNGITWVSEGGGSAVLTQAMEILAKQNVKLTKHKIFLMDPTTSPKQALQAAYKVGIEPDRDAIKTGVLNHMANRELAGLTVTRFKNEKGYKLGNAAFDLTTKVGSAVGIGAAGVSALGAAGVTMAAPSIPMMLTIGSALGVVTTAVGVGEAVVSTVAPHLYNKHIGKIR